ncbi:MAG: threonine synthase, partial [Pseudomonadota bacterium]
VSLGAPHRPVSFTVPTGNFGDIFAGYIAKSMGLPIGQLVVATNHNDILHRTLTTGAYTKDTVRPSISPSMDIQVSSNFERALFDAYGRDGAVVAAQMEDLKGAGGFTISQGAIDALRATYASGRASEAETKSEIARVLEESQELICPHTACGTRVARGFLGDVPMVTLATAHPAKFPDAVEAATGIRPPLPNRMADLYERSERVARVPNDLAALEDFIREQRRT